MKSKITEKYGKSIPAAAKLVQQFNEKIYTPALEEFDAQSVREKCDDAITVYDYISMCPEFEIGEEMKYDGFKACEGYSSPRSYGSAGHDETLRSIGFFEHRGKDNFTMVSDVVADGKHFTFVFHQRGSIEVYPLDTIGVDTTLFDKLKCVVGGSLHNVVARPANEMKELAEDMLYVKKRVLAFIGTFYSHTDSIIKAANNLS